MAIDPFSPIAPARIRVLLVPAGKIKRSRFMTFIEQLQPESTVRLGDISPDPRPDRTMFSPLHNPDGMLLYHMTTSVPPASYLALSPLELFREPLMILGVADGEEYGGREAAEGADDGGVDSSMALSRQQMKDTVEILRDQYPRALVHRVLFFNSPFSSPQTWMPEETTLVPPASQYKSTTLKTVMCDLSALLLAEMTTLTKSLQALPEVNVTSISTQQHTSNRSIFSIARQPSYTLGSPDSPGSRSASPLQSTAAPSTPTMGNRTSSPLRLEVPSRSSTPQESATDDGAKSPSGDGPAPSPTEATTPTSLQRPRALQRFSIQGFGSGSAEEKARVSNECRRSLLTAEVSLMAGRVQEALEQLRLVALKATDCTDHLATAKSLELMLACFLILLKLELDFEIPPICTADHKGPALQGSTDVLIAIIPDLVQTIQNYYALAAKLDNTWPLPLLIAECKVRTSKLRIFIARENGDVLAEVFSDVKKNTDTESDELPPLKGVYGGMVKTITDTLFEGIDLVNGAAAASDLERAVIYSEVATCLAKLGLARKRAFVIKLLIDVLVPALLQARKLGAAEQGIHPATGLFAGGIAQADRKSPHDTLTTFLEDFTGAYGIAPRKSTTARAAEDLSQYGSFELKTEVLLRCINVCEAMADLGGVLKFSSTLLNISLPPEPPRVDQPNFRSSLLSQDQTRLYSNITRTVQAAVAYGMSNIEAEYWHEHLVHSVAYSAATVPRKLVLQKNLEKERLMELAQRASGTAKFEFQAFGRPRTKDGQPPDAPLVVNEPAHFIVNLRNPFAFDQPVRSIKLLTEEGEVLDGTSDNSVQMLPYGAQGFKVEVVARRLGSYKLTGLRIKVDNCLEEDFPISSVAVEPRVFVNKIKEQRTSVATVDSITKQLKRASTESHSSSATFKEGLEEKTLSINVIPEQPSLKMAVGLRQDTLEVLEGERKTFLVTVAHEGTSARVPAEYLHLNFRNNAVDRFEEEKENETLLSTLHDLDKRIARTQWKTADIHLPPQLPPSSDATFKVQVLGSKELDHGFLELYYAATDPPPEVDNYFVTSCLSRQIHVSVEPTIRTYDFQILSGKEAHRCFHRKHRTASINTHFVLVFSFQNMSQRTLRIEIGSNEGEVGGIMLTDRKWQYEPGERGHFAVLLKKVYLPHGEQPIPDPQYRQFIVTAARETDRESRQRFWYKQALLNAVQIQWIEDKSGRRGDVDISRLNFYPQWLGPVMATLEVKMRVVNVTDKGWESRSPVFDDDYGSTGDELRRSKEETVFYLKRGDKGQIWTQVKNMTDRTQRVIIAPTVSLRPDPDDGISASQILAELDSLRCPIVMKPYEWHQLNAQLTLPAGITRVDLGIEILEGAYPVSDMSRLCTVIGSEIPS